MVLGRSNMILGRSTMVIANISFTIITRTASTSSGSSGRSSTVGMFPGWQRRRQPEVGGGGGERENCSSVVEAVQEVGHAEGGGEHGDPYEGEGHETLRPQREGVIFLHHWTA
jgi:hypothetical protein